MSETFIEWGVDAHDGFGVRVANDERQAREIVAMANKYPPATVSLVQRTVTRTEWVMVEEAP